MDTVEHTLGPWDLHEHDVRIEAMMWMPGVIGDMEAFSRQFEDFCDDLPTEQDGEIYQELPELLKFADEDNEPEPWQVAEKLLYAKRTGFLVQAATPTRQYLTGGSYLSGWGHYYTAWLYVDTQSELPARLAGWAEAKHAADEAKAVAA